MGCNVSRTLRLGHNRHSVSIQSWIHITYQGGVTFDRNHKCFSSHLFSVATHAFTHSFSKDSLSQLKALEECPAVAVHALKTDQTHLIPLFLTATCLFRTTYIIKTLPKTT